MNEVSDRLKLIRKSLKLTIREFAQEIYYSHSVYGQVEFGSREANDRIIQLISSRFNVSKEWLKTGEDGMFHKAPAEKLQRMIDLFNELPPKFQDYGVQQVEQLLKVQKTGDGKSPEHQD